VDILRREVKDWLDGVAPEIDLLVTPPARIFEIEEIGGKSPTRKTIQARLAL
jgi:hypothetical protein